MSISATENPFSHSPTQALNNAFESLVVFPIWKISATSVNRELEIKKYLEEQIKVEGSKLQIGVSGIQYTYNMNLAIYTKNVDGSIIYDYSNNFQLIII